MSITFRGKTHRDPNLKSFVDATFAQAKEQVFVTHVARERISEPPPPEAESSVKELDDGRALRIDRVPAAPGGPTVFILCQRQGASR